MSDTRTGSASGPHQPDQGRELTDQERAAHEWRGGVDSKLDSINNRLDELFDLVRRLPCGDHAAELKMMNDRGTKGLGEAEQRIAGLEAQMALVSSGSGVARRAPSEEQRPHTGGGHRAVSERDLQERLESTQRTVLAELDGRVEHSVEERLDALEAAKLKARAELEAEQLKARATLEAAQDKALSRKRETVRFGAEMLKYVLPTLLAAGVYFGARCEIAHPAEPDSVARAKLAKALGVPAPKPDVAQFQTK
jgi:hypothetical protein